MSEPHRSDSLHATDVNFSVKLSFGVLVANGELSVDTLSERALEARAEQITKVASRVTVEASVEMNERMSGLADIGLDAIKLFDPAYSPTLDGADFGKYEMKFPARVTLRTTTGEEYVAEVDAPAGAPGRPLDETDRAVRRKFRRAATGILADPEGALEAVLHIDESTDVRDVIALLTAR